MIFVVMGAIVFVGVDLSRGGDVIAFGGMIRWEQHGSNASAIWHDIVGLRM